MHVTPPADLTFTDKFLKATLTKSGHAAAFAKAEKELRQTIEELVNEPDAAKKVALLRNIQPQLAPIWTTLITLRDTANADALQSKSDKTDAMRNYLSLGKTLNDVIADRDVLRDKHDRLVDDYDALEAQTNALQTKYDTLARTSGDQLKQIEDLRETLKDREAELKTASDPTETNRLSEEVRDLKKKLAEADTVKQQVATLEADYRKTVNEFTKMMKEVSGLQDVKDKDAFTVSMHTLGAHAAGLGRKIVQLSNQNEQLERDHKEMGETAQEWERLFNKERDTTAGQLARIAELEGQMKADLTTKAGVDARIGQLESEKSALSKRLSAAIQKKNDDSIESDQALRDSDSRTRAVQQSLLEAREKNQTLQSTVGNLRSQIDEKEALITELRNNSAALDGRAAQTAEQLRLLEHSSEVKALNLQKEIADLKKADVRSLPIEQLMKYTAQTVIELNKYWTGVEVLQHGLPNPRNWSTNIRNLAELGRMLESQATVVRDSTGPETAEYKYLASFITRFSLVQELDLATWQDRPADGMARKRARLVTEHVQSLARDERGNPMDPATLHSAKRIDTGRFSVDDVVRILDNRTIYTETEPNLPGPMEQLLKYTEHRKANPPAKPDLEADTALGLLSAAVKGETLPYTPGQIEFAVAAETGADKTDPASWRSSNVRYSYYTAVIDGSVDMIPSERKIIVADLNKITEHFGLTLGPRDPIPLQTGHSINQTIDMPWELLLEGPSKCMTDDPVVSWREASVFYAMNLTFEHRPQLLIDYFGSDDKADENLRKIKAFSIPPMDRNATLSKHMQEEDVFDYSHYDKVLGFAWKDTRTLHGIANADVELNEALYRNRKKPVDVKTYEYIRQIKELREKDEFWAHRLLDYLASTDRHEDKCDAGYHLDRWLASLVGTISDWTHFIREPIHLVTRLRQIAKTRSALVSLMPAHSIWFLGAGQAPMPFPQPTDMYDKLALTSAGRAWHRVLRDNLARLKFAADEWDDGDTMGSGDDDSDTPTTAPATTTTTTSQSGPTSAMVDGRATVYANAAGPTLRRTQAGAGPGLAKAATVTLTDFSRGQPANTTRRPNARTLTRDRENRKSSAPRVGSFSTEAVKDYKHPEPVVSSDAALETKDAMRTAKPPVTTGPKPQDFSHSSPANTKRESKKPNRLNIK